MVKEGKQIESAIQRLEKIVAELGEGGVDIETGLERFREGVDLVKFCRVELKKSENEFKKLKAELDEDREEDIKPEDIPF